ncbi:hypothetical protein ACA910_021339 [Epithemia clementina (nom. ined.)]
MAEDVQAALDEMVPALQDLQDRQIFTAHEIHQIVDRRRNSEYELRRLQDVRKADFLRYIQAEVDLEQLRHLRWKKWMREQKQQQQQQATKQDDEDSEKKQDPKDSKKEDKESIRHKIGDTHIVHHIHNLWKRTLQKFGKSDVGLYFQYAEYCKEVQAHAILSRLWAEALQLFPHEAALWAEAASHEFFVVGSIQNARVLLQRGIRLQEPTQPACQELWCHLFTLELHLVERLKARRQILLQGGETSAGGEDEGRGDEDVKDTGKAEQGEGENDEKVNNDDTTETMDDSTKPLLEEKDEFQVARVVYRNAIRTIPRNVAFRLKFWDQCRLFSDTFRLQKDIVDSIRNDLCKDNPEAWMAWALYQWERKTTALKQQQQEENDKNNDQTSQADDGEDGEGQGQEKDESESEKDPAQEEEKGDNDNRRDILKGPSSKKRKLNGASSSTEEEAMSVLDVLRQATRALATREMYLKATRMITRYVASLQEEQGDDDDDDDSEEDPDIAAGIELLETLFHEAEQSDFFSSELVMEQALLLSRLDRKDEAAQCLQRFADARPTEDALKVWLYLAELSEPGPVPVLQAALDKTDINHATYYELLLHLMGAKFQAKDENGLLSLFEKIALLTPGFLPLQEIEEPIFGVRHALDACLQLLQYLNLLNDVAQARKVYKAVLMESSLGSIFVQSFDDESMMDLIEEAVKVEKAHVDNDKRSNKSQETRRKNLIRLYDEAAKLFGNSAVGQKYQERKRQEMLGRKEQVPNNQNSNFEVHVQDAHVSVALIDAFEKYQVAHLKANRAANGRQTLGEKQGCIGWKDIGNIFEKLNKEDQATWCVETSGDTSKHEVWPKDFLSPTLEIQQQHRRGYCSFLVQKDQAAYQHVLIHVPVQDPAMQQWTYSSSGAVWFFFGRNPVGSFNLEGRPEHTDSISSDGTWHYQLSGCKTWILRPTRLLLNHCKERRQEQAQHSDEGEWNDETRIHVQCHEGDILCVNTRLWFHRTIIPPQNVPSVSYARDFYCKKSERAKSACASPSKAPGPTSGNQKETMMNLDGLYATDEIEAGTIIFTEKDMPDCEMHRSSTNANCEVVELEDGTSAVVSLRNIAPGEFFCVAESDEEHDEEEEDEEEEEEEQVEED